MKCNAAELAGASCAPCTLEGRLNCRRAAPGHAALLNPPAFKERWFRLVNNYLFYFKLSEMGKFDTSNPAGVFVMENTSIQMEHGQAIPFAFSISFIDDSEKRHIFAARSEESVVQWVMHLRQCSYEYLRSKLYTLQSKIYSVTGNDPLLLVPRNEGAKLWAPSVPFSTAPACSSTSAGFSCHLHTNGTTFTLERSKSAVQCSSTRAHHEQKHTTHISLHASTSSSDHNFNIERSKTEVIFKNKLIPDSVSYSRPAPSPPVRRKASPRLNRDNLETGDDSTKRYAFLEQIPVAPKRKISPKNLDVNNDTSNVCSTKCNGQEDDLIKF